jgi:hypothetical protein
VMYAVKSRSAVAADGWFVAIVRLIVFWSSAAVLVGFMHAGAFVCFDFCFDVTRGFLE